VRIWETQSGLPRLTLRGHDAKVTSVAFSPDGRTLASGAHDDTVRIWDAQSGLPRLTLHGHDQAVTCVAFSPDGLTLASAAWDNTVRIWDTQTGQCRAVLLATSTGWAVLLPDGRYKQVGNVDGLFWQAIGLCRFEPGELDEFMPGLRVADDQPLDALPPWVPPTPAEPLAPR
jgi:WD40 repeat protein